MPHKRLAIDVRLWKQGGVGRYIRNLVIELHKLKSSYHVTLIARPQEAAEIKKTVPVYNLITSTARWHTLAEQTEFMRQLYSQNFDLVHFPYVSHPILYRKPFVITIHDLTTFTHATGTASTQTPLLYWFKQQAYRMVLNHGLHASRAIMVPSNTVAHELEQSFHILHNRIVVTYEGVDANLMHAKTKDTFVPKHDFYLYVGNCYPHKNTELILRLAQTSERPFVLVVPEDMFTDRLLLRAQELGVEKKITLVRRVSDGVLKYLYQHARALVFPSFKEGFGLPIVEAAYFNCPLLVSDIAAFREVAPPGTVFFDPYSYDKCSEAVTKLPSRAQTSYHRSYLALFSFTEMAKKTSKIYEEHLG